TEDETVVGLVIKETDEGHMPAMDQRIVDDVDKHLGKTCIGKNLQIVDLPVDQHVFLFDPGYSLANHCTDSVPTGLSRPDVLVIVGEPDLFLDHVSDIPNLVKIA